MVMRRAGPIIRSGSRLSVALNLDSGQIVFPATQVASTGANTLDDYEEGSWTPTIRGSTTAGTQTYGVQVAKYIKIGRLVTLTCQIGTTAIDGATAGNVQIAGIPFASENVTNSRSAAAPAVSNIDFSAGYSYAVLILLANDTVLTLFQCGDNASVTNLVAASLGASTGLHFSISYLAAA